VFEGIRVPSFVLTSTLFINRYKKETRAIGQLLQKTMMSKYGPDKIEEHYKEFDTICDATQERQDAIHILVDEYVG